MFPRPIFIVCRNRNIFLLLIRRFDDHQQIGCLYSCLQSWTGMRENERPRLLLLSVCSQQLFDGGSSAEVHSCSSERLCPADLEAASTAHQKCSLRQCCTVLGNRRNRSLSFLLYDWMSRVCGAIPPRRKATH